MNDSFGEVIIVAVCLVLAVLLIMWISAPDSGTVISVSGGSALVDRGRGARDVADNPFPDLKPGDRVTLRYRPYNGYEITAKGDPE